MCLFHYDINETFEMIQVETHFVNYHQKQENVANEIFKF